MNKHCFQVIFSKSQQQFVVVSELAKSAGKSSTMPKVKVDDLFSLLFENLVSKENSQSETWQNNQLQAGKLVTNSANGKLTLDATNVKAERWEGEVQDFEAISRQDITKYNSEQVQGGVSASLAFGTSGVNANAAYNSAKLNTAQVENQTSINIGKGGMNVTVQGNTHLDGAIITSEADKENNRFQTGTLTTSDIQNHSELKTRSAAISGGTSGVNPMSALSLLGNKNESERSTTRAAIGENIAINLTQDPNAETTLNNLNRDTQNANQKVTKHDIREAKETQELVKGIGEISDKAFQIYTHSEREKVAEAKLALGKAQAQKASKEEIGKLEANLDRLQKEFDKNYGTGSKTKRAVDAVTAALQGLAAKDAGQAVVGLASPYLNAEIKKHTEGDTQANLIAHALLGAVEAAATGNNLLAGAAAGAGSEAAAKVITETLYKGRTTEQLTEAEKQNVVFLSQLAGGLASGIIGDSTQSVAIGADIGKRAVENNALLDSQVSDLFKDLEKAEKEGHSLEEVFTQYKELSDKQYSEFEENCVDSAICRFGTEKLLEDANQKAFELVGFFNSRLSTLSGSAQEKFIEFVITENAKEIESIDEARTPVEKAVVILINNFVEDRENKGIKVSPKIASFAKKTASANPIEYLSKPKQKVNSSSVGDIVRTPTSHAEDFERKRDSKGNAVYVNKYTGEIWSKSNTRHSDKAGEWKVGLNGKEPTASKKITIGDSDGKIIKKDDK